MIQRWIVALFPYFLIALTCLEASPERALGQPGSPPSREVEVVYRGTIGPIPGKAQTIRVWIPLARTRDGQKILTRDIQCPFPYIITEESLYGNQLLYGELERPLPQEVSFQIRYRVLINGEGRGDSESEATLGRYLQSSRLMRVTGEVRRRMRKLLINGQGTVRDKARVIYEDVIRSMVYDKTTPGWGRGDTIRACRLGRGNCTDFHSLFIPMAHALGIPARFKIGLQIPETEAGEIPSYHCWAEFYEPGVGWVPVDVSEAWKHPEMREAYFGGFDPRKFLISVGRDIMLLPPQSGGPVNILFDPYVEVDRVPFEQYSAEFSFVDIKEAKQGGEERRQR